MRVLERLSRVARNNRRIVEKTQEPATMFSEDDLLLGPFNGCRELGCIRLLQLLTGL